MINDESLFRNAIRENKYNKGGSPQTKSLNRQKIMIKKVTPFNCVKPSFCVDNPFVFRVLAHRKENCEGSHFCL